jgi:uracil-DNA glycosylase family protein
MLHPPISEMSAAPFVPKTTSLNKLRAASKGCRGCPLYREATQTVFGEGPERARVVLLGEQPGNSEDLAGHPFVGPSGRLLSRALSDAGLNREDLYISNVVKHFKFLRKGKIREHHRPSGPEIRACRPWLEAELRIIQPEITVCLGASAAKGLLGRKVTLKNERGTFTSSPYGGRLLLTVHPSSILRIPDDAARHGEYAYFVRDLKRAAGL